MGRKPAKSQLGPIFCQREATAIQVKEDGIKIAVLKAVFLPFFHFNRHGIMIDNQT